LHENGKRTPAAQGRRFFRPLPTLCPPSIKTLDRTLYSVAAFLTGAKAMGRQEIRYHSSGSSDFNVDAARGNDPGAILQSEQK
jgi:hypothetical protein